MTLKADLRILNMQSGYCSFKTSDYSGKMFKCSYYAILKVPNFVASKVEKNKTHVLIYIVDHVISQRV